MKSRALQSVVVAFLIGASAVAGLVEAQGFPGRGQGRGGNRSAPDSGDPAASTGRRNAAAAVVTEPALALERELPSLRTDLLLDPAQVEAWTGFERSVRDAAQAAHARQRRNVELRQAGMVGGVDLPPGAAAGSLQAFIDDERNRAQLLANVAGALEQLTRILDPRQSGMINRRIVQALRDPLGPS